MIFKTKTGPNGWMGENNLSGSKKDFPLTASSVKSYV